MTNSVFLALALIGTYCLGSISFAIVLSRIAQLQDPRQYGSGNPGATNILRSGRKLMAAAVLLLDATKGWLAAFGVAWLAPQLNVSPDWALLAGLLAGLLAFLGHLFPLFHRFQGGKGVATFIGVALGLAPWYGLLYLILWLVIAVTTRYSSLAALLSCVLTVFVLGFVNGYDALFVTLLAMSLLLIWRHQSNINALLRGKETKIGHRR